MSKTYDRALAFLDDALDELAVASPATALRVPRPVREMHRSTDGEHDRRGDGEGLGAR